VIVYADSPYSGKFLNEFVIISGSSLEAVGATAPISPCGRHHELDWTTCSTRRGDVSARSRSTSSRHICPQRFRLRERTTRK